MSGVINAHPAYRRTVLEPLFASARSHAPLYRRLDLAHAISLHEVGLLTDQEARMLLQGIDALERDDVLTAGTDSGAFEDLFFLREDRLKARLGADLAGRLHIGRSRNDIEATIFRLTVRGRLDGTLASVAGLLGTVIEAARREAGTVILAYTHGQPAQPTTYGHYLGAFAEVLLRDLSRLRHARYDLDLCPLGAAAITTTGFPIDRARLAELLGFRAPQENSYGCIAAVDQFAAVYAALRLLLLNVGRLAQDLAFWTGCEVGQAVMPDGFVQVSSIMPQKRNPLAIEHLRTMASLGAGQCEAFVSTLHNTPFADMVDAEGPTQAVGLAAFDMAARVLDLLGPVLEGLRIDAGRARANIAASCATMTEVSDSLVRLEGLSFRQAHEICSVLARRLLDGRRGMDGLAAEDLEAAFAEALGRLPRVRVEDLVAAATPEHAIAVRERLGGPGPAALAASLERYAAALDRHRDQAALGTEVIRTAEARLAAAVASRLTDG